MARHRRADEGPHDRARPCSCPIYIHTHNGLRTIEGRYAELAETLGVSRGEFIRHVVLPGAMPGFLLGMRFAVTSSLLALVVVEVSQRHRAASAT